ncbi:MAG TPA: histidine kinase, partial [Candidatus Riflebacteria bacterium]|nr:histidine kinase [Candidatus Riflebacteria bacterium]
LSGKGVMVVDGDYMQELMLEKQIVASITVVSTIEDAIDRLSNGEADVVLTPRMSALYYLEKKGIANIELSAQSIHSTEYCFAFANGNKALLAKFTEGLKVIEASGEYRQIQEKWLGIYGAREKDSRAVFRYLATITMPLLVILLLVFIWSWTLRRQVARKTRELQQSEAQFRSLVEGAPTGIFVQSDGKFDYLNDEASQLFGATSIVQLFNKPVLDLIDKSAHENYSRCVGALSPENKQPALAIVIRRIDGIKVPVEVTVAPIDYRGKDSALVFVHDITEKLRLNEQLQQAQKMEAIGQLAGGVAHDYNNMLGVILGYTEMALDSVDKEAPPHEYLSEIHKAALRSAEITGQLLAFARKQTIAPRILDMNETIDGMLKMLRRLIGEAISLAWVPGSGNLAVKMDPTQINQILANLCVNARDAMSGAGKLLIETTAVAFDEDYCSDHPGTLTGDYVQLSVSDDGCGIDAAVKDKIFEPFFTTKSVGKGTGLGLATVFGIVKQNHGFINVYSEIGEGTTFKIYIPMHDVHHVQMLKSPAIEPVAGSGETILIVEDDPSILRMASKMLTRAGYAVIATDSPTEAIRQGENSAQKIDLLLTDVVMPEMNGRELFDKLQICRPGLRCLFMSGYTANVIAQHGVLKEGINFVAKPFSNADLVKAVREALVRPT